MEILLAIVGLVIGAVVTYLLIQSQLKGLNDAHKAQTRRLREDLEQDFALRMQTAIQSAQADHDRTVKQIQDDYEQRIALLESQSGATSAAPSSAPKPSPAPAPLSDPWDNRSRAVDPPPAPVATPAPEPVAAPAPAPEPEPAEEEPVIIVAPVISRPAIAQLKQACNSADPEVRALVADELADHLVGSEAVQSIALLEKLAGDRQASVRVAALETLAAAQIPDTIPLLTKALRDASPAVVRIASKGLQGMKGEAIAPDFIPQTLPSNGVNKIAD